MEVDARFDKDVSQFFFYMHSDDSCTSFQVANANKQQNNSLLFEQLSVHKTSS